MDKKKKWYQTTEFLVNAAILVAAMLCGYLYAWKKNSPGHFWEDFGKGTFFITFFGGFFQRAIAGSNRHQIGIITRTTNDLAEKINAISGQTHEKIELEFAESARFRSEVLETLKAVKIENTAQAHSENGPMSEVTVGEAKENFERVIKEKKDFSKIVFAAKQYSDAADKYSDQLRDLPDVEVDVDLENLSIEKIQEIHAQFFPPGYEIAGKLRTVPVYINNSGHTQLGPEGTIYVPPKPGEVHPRLLALVSQWNKEVKQLRVASELKKLNSIAHFHATFTSIHPFLDANGRVARILLKRQIKTLFNRDVIVSFKEELPRYYAALIAANKGSLELLINLLSEKINA